MFGDIISKLREIYSTNKEGLELEVKYGSYYKPKDTGRTKQFNFDSKVPDVHFFRLLNNLKHNKEYTDNGTEVSSVSYYPNNIRKLYTNIPGGMSSTQWQRKTTISNFDLREYDIRVSANNEENLVEDENLINMKVTSTRERTRYKFSTKLFNIDMTETMTQNYKGVMVPAYEVEIEFNGSKDQLSLFENETEKIFKILRGTNMLYKTHIKNKLNSDVGSVLTGEHHIKKKALVEARNIKRKDLVLGGIVGNKFFNQNVPIVNQENNFNIYPENPRPEHLDGSGYMITFKADGLRKMLIIHYTGIWLVYPPHEYNLVISSITNSDSLKKLLTNHSGTVFDGELVTPKTENGSLYNYIIFDCIATTDSGNSIQGQPYSDRKKFVDGISRVLGKNQYLAVRTKETEEITSVPDFFSLTTKFLNNRKNLWYKEDGLMYIPIDTVYNPHSERYATKNRILTDVPDTCKWKARENITIDFAIRWVQPQDSIGQQLELQVYSERVHGNVPFRDTWYPIKPDMIDSTNPLVANLKSGTIVEFAWVPDVGKLVPVKIRLEKGSPNREDIALNNWHDIMDAITEEELTGNSLKPVFNYHNKIKHCLYDMAKTDYDGLNSCLFRGIVQHNVDRKYRGINLLDIGSGRGGDIPKWENLEDRDDPNNTGFVVAVEPFADNRKEFNDRLEKNTKINKNKVKLVATGGEDTVQITNAVKSFIPSGKVDVISLMLSLSFFWSSEKHLESLVNTIVNNLKPGGLIIFLTIDGDQIDASGITETNILSANIKLFPKGPNDFSTPLDFILPNTIVGGQHEYLVHINDLTTRLQKYGINLVDKQIADQELLSEECMRFSSLYSYGFFENNDTNTFIKNIPGQPINILQQLVAPITGSKSSVISPPVISPPVISPPSKPVITPPVISPPSKPAISAPSKPVSSTSVISPPSKPVIAPPSKPVSSTSVIAPPSKPVSSTSVIAPPSKPVIAPPSKPRVDENILPMLTVTYMKGNKIVGGPAINDDTIAPLTCTWYKNLYRIATIGGGSCFIHAVLKAFDPKYQENSDAEFRISLVENVRRDLSDILGRTREEYNSYMGLPPSNYPGSTFWASTANGSYPRLLMEEIKNEDLIKLTKVDYSLNGLTYLFNSTAMLGDEIYQYISDILNINVIILRADKNDLYYVNRTYSKYSNNTIVIIGNTYHYEVLAIDTNQGLKTVLLPDDEFLIALINKFPGAKSKIIGEERDPDEMFVENFVDAFGTKDGFVVPDFNTIFSEDDPFMIMYNRLVPKISEAYDKKFGK